MDRFTALPAEKFPLTQRHAADLISGTGHDRFEFTLGRSWTICGPRRGEVEVRGSAAVANRRRSPIAGPGWGPSATSDVNGVARFAKQQRFPERLPQAPGKPLASPRQEHAAPLTVKLVGELSFEVNVPWKPNEVFAPGAIEPL